MRSLLLPCLSRAFFLGLHTTSRATWGRSRSYNQAADVPSSKVTDNVPRNPAKNSRIVAAFVSRMHSITNLPVSSNRQLRSLLGEHRGQYTFHCSQGCSFL